MKRAWLSDAASPLGKAAARGLKAQGWQVDAGRHEAEARIMVLERGGDPCALPDGSGTVILLAPAGDRLALAALSLEAQRLAIAAAPAVRVNAVAVEQGQEDRIGASLDWLAGAEMVTGQLILLSSAPGHSIPL